MAEPSNSNGEQMDYWCHSCKCNISSITESFTCSNCGSGFIEEVESSRQEENNDNLFSILTSSSGELHQDNFFNILNEMNLFGNNNQNLNSVNLGRFLSTMISGAQANGSGQIIRLMHGNPDDYVWSADGLDSVITQLLNQIDNAGPPPMSQSEINNLNEIIITDDYINKLRTCPICLEDFQVDEKVKELKCKHFFHNDCIVEWLKLHSTCCICRTEFTTDKQQQQQTSNATTSSNVSSNTESTSRPADATTSSATNQPTTGYFMSDDDLD